MTARPRRSTTAFLAGMSLLVPQAAPIAYAQDVEPLLYCLDFSAPPCPEGEPVDGSVSPEDAQAGLAARAAEEEAAAAAQAEADAAAAAQAEADAAAAAQAEADAAAAQAEADAAAAAAAQAEADAAAAAQAEADAAAAAQAETDAAAAAQAEADAAAAAAQAEADAADAAQAEADAADAAQAEADAAQAEADAAAAAQADADAAVAAQAEADAAAAEAEAAAVDAAAAQAEADAAAALAEADAADAAADAVAPDAAPIDPTVDPTQEDVAPPAAAAAASESPDATADPAAAVVEELLDDTNTRSAEQEFETDVTAGTLETAAPSDDSGEMTNFQRALLLGLGAVAVGAILSNGRDEVVANTGDRVVVQGDNGLVVYRDDDALLRQPGATLRTETFNDGSTRSVLLREDGSQVVTIRDARGRVLRRTSYLANGQEVMLFDDLTESAPVDVVTLRAVKPAPQVLTASQATTGGLQTYFAADLAYDPGRTFSLRQIREIQDVRALVPALDLDTVTFASGSAAIDPTQLASLIGVGLAMEDMLAANPAEVFLIEGHTDATGSDALNLALSDRRAETVALALTENFAIPPENIVVQGYGEAFLKINTQVSEAANRRATVRRITPLLQTASN